MTKVNKSPQFVGANIEGEQQNNCVYNFTNNLKRKPAFKSLHISEFLFSAFDYLVVREDS